VQAVQGLLAVGTSQGYVLMYDSNQQPVMTLGSPAHAAAAGAVTALAISRDTTRLLAGHQNGQASSAGCVAAESIDKLILPGVIGCAVGSLDG
jgi:hypothetical protein